MELLFPFLRNWQWKKTTKKYFSLWDGMGSRYLTFRMKENEITFLSESLWSLGCCNLLPACNPKTSNPLLKLVKKSLNVCFDMRWRVQRHFSSKGSKLNTQWDNRLGNNLCCEGACFSHVKRLAPNWWCESVHVASSDVFTLTLNDEWSLSVSQSMSQLVS